MSQLLKQARDHLIKIVDRIESAESRGDARFDTMGDGLMATWVVLTAMLARMCAREHGAGSDEVASWHGQMRRDLDRAFSGHD